MLTKIISGGQIGADVAALRAARAEGIETGGFVPSGWRTLDGPDFTLRDLFGCTETRTSYYPERTHMNVKWADGTVRFATNFASRGEICTMKAINLYHKPHLDIDLNRLRMADLMGFTSRADALATWIIDNNIHVLNVAGNASHDLEPLVERIITFTLLELDRKGFPPVKQQSK